MFFFPHCDKILIWKFFFCGKYENGLTVHSLTLHFEL
jgi:hypothetical protein